MESRQHCISLRYSSSRVPASDDERYMLGTALTQVYTPKGMAQVGVPALHFTCTDHAFGCPFAVKLSFGRGQIEATSSYEYKALQKASSIMRSYPPDGWENPSCPLSRLRLIIVQHACMPGGHDFAPADHDLTRIPHKLQKLCQRSYAPEDNQIWDFSAAPSTLSSLENEISFILYCRLDQCLTPTTEDGRVLTCCILCRSFRRPYDRTAVC